MFDRLDDLLIRYEELMEELGSPEVASDTNRFRKLMKEQSDLAFLSMPRQIRRKTVHQNHILSA